MAHEYRDNPVMLGKYICNHSIPLLSTFINFLITDIVFIRHHWKVIARLGTFYLILNFVMTKAKGTPVYPFLKWEDHTSFLLAGGILLSGVVMFNVLVEISYRVKKRTPYVKQGD
mmetsp:Transcript_14850/g.14427  ORF Transcript_14850/g.14427 Transcript_14850/m.14427 type:complete len:115 (+) Transcript_14850:108-452(+)